MEQERARPRDLSFGFGLDMFSASHHLETVTRLTFNVRSFRNLVF